MKRRDENRQLRPEELEALENVTEERDTYTRASADVLQTRRILKPKRKSYNASSDNDASSTSMSPFGSLSGSTGGAGASNPFSGLSSLSKRSSVASGDSKSLGFNLAPTQNSMKQPFGSTEITKSSSSALSSTNSNSNSNSANSSKIQRLNQSFLQWMSKQIVEHPISIWSAGLQNYIDYAEKIAEESPVPTSASTASATTTPSLPSSTNFSVNPSSDSKPASTFSFKPSGNASSDAKPASSFSFKPSTNTSSDANSSSSFSFKPTGDTSSDAKPASSFSFKPSGNASSDANPSSSFSFKPSGNASSDANPSSSFSFKPSGNASSGANPSSSFSFKPSTNASSATTSGGFGSSGLSFSAPSASAPSFSLSSAGTNSATTNGGGEAGDEEDGDAMPALEPEEVLRNDQDKDEILYETACKLFRFSKEDKEWRESGKGTLRVTREPGSTIKRILIRNSLGKITLNSNICKGMNFKKSGKNGVQFMAGDDSGKLQAYMAKVKNDVVSDTVDFLSKAEMES